MLYSAEIESSSLYCARVMSDEKDLKTEKKCIKGILGTVAKKMRKNYGNREKRKIY